MRAPVPAPLWPGGENPFGWYPGSPGTLIPAGPTVAGPVGGKVVARRNRQAPTSDVDFTRRLYRRYVSTGSTDVQLLSGTQRRLRSGYRWPYRGAGWLSTPVPPKQASFEPTFAGYPVRGPDPWSMARQWVQGPGRQPWNPGGPASISGPIYINPMTG